MTAVPSAGLGSAEPTSRTPALTCRGAPNDPLVPGPTSGRADGRVPPDCACAGPITPSSAAAPVIAAVMTKRRRRRSTPSSAAPLGFLAGQSDEGLRSYHE